MYSLDANALISAFRGHQRVLARLKQQSPDDIAISSIVSHELYYGAFKGSRSVDNVVLVDALAFRVLEFDQDDARCAGEIRAQLTLIGAQIGAYDMLIAGQALSRSLTLVTHNTREFERVNGLRIEDWEI